MNLSERNPGCYAELRDNGRERVLVPVCMGGLLVNGAEVTVTGCNNSSVCVPQLPEGTITIGVVIPDATNPDVVARVVVVTRDSAVTPTPSSYQGA